MNIDACLSHKSDNWKTPSDLYNYFINFLGCFDTFEYCSRYDQYEKTYRNSYLFMNPPYSHLKTEKFINYLLGLLKLNNIIYLLIPARTDTKYFTTLLPHCTYINFFKGRLHFNDGKCAPFPSMLMKLQYLADSYSPLIHNFSLKEFVYGSTNSKN